MSTVTAEPRALAVWILFILLLGQAIGAIGGGVALVAGPQGEIIHMPVSQLDDSPFDSFLIPGLILLIVLGILPLAAAIGLWHRRSWAWWASGVVGCGLVIWIAVELTIITFSWFHVAYATLGVLIVLAALPRSVRRYCGIGR